MEILSIHVLLALEKKTLEGTKRLTSSQTGTVRLDVISYFSNTLKNLWMGFW